MLRSCSTKLFSPFSSHSSIHKSNFFKTRQLRFYSSTQFNDEIHAEFRPKLSVVGIGGGGCNTVENMLRRGVEGVDFYVCNTDSQVLEKSKLPMDQKIQLGSKLTGGLGAGAKPDIGRRAAEEALDLLVDKLKTSHLCFITAGMGGGTGTGASPVVGKALREKGVLCIGVVTKPFFYEGRIRMNIAEEGINEMKNSVDTLIVVPNQRVISNDRKQLFAEAFDQVNNVLYEGIKSVTDVIITPGLINLDFADVKTITKGPGWGLMGTGRADGKERARDATNAALNNPLLSETTKQNATGVLVSIAGGQDLGLLEIDEVVEIINKQVNKEANVIFGTTTHDELEGSIQVSLIITGPWESESVLQTKEQVVPVVTPQTPLVKSFSSNEVRQQQPKTRIAHETKSFKPKEEKLQHEQQKEVTPAPEQPTQEEPKPSGWFSRWI